MAPRAGQSSKKPAPQKKPPRPRTKAKDPPADDYDELPGSSEEEEEDEEEAAAARIAKTEKKRKAERDRIAADQAAKKAKELRIAEQEAAKEAAKGNVEDPIVSTSLIEAQTEAANVERVARIEQRNSDPGYIKSKEALRDDLDRRFGFMPEEIHGIATPTFDFKAKRPSTQPEVTVWAFYHALKNCTYKGLEAVTMDDERLPLQPNLVNIRTTKRGTDEPYVMNFTKQNADAMMRHLYGAPRSEMEQCKKCSLNNGAIADCYVHESKPSTCTNCDWNHSGPPCTYNDTPTPKKRKRKRVPDSDSESDSSVTSSVDSAVEAATKLIETLDRTTCLAIAHFFKKATGKMKKGKGKVKGQKGKKRGKK